VLTGKSPQQIQEIIDRTHELISEHKLQAVPPVYAVWFTYVAGANPALNREIDQIISQEQPVTVQTCEGLVEKALNVTNDKAAYQAVGDQIQEQLEKISEFLNDAGESTASFGDTLAGASQVMSSSTNPENMKEVIEGLVAASRQMEEKTRTLEQQLQKSNEEVSQLTESLAEISREAKTDQLTGIANRKAFDETLRAALEHARTEGEPLSLLLADIDHFKKFNDTWGHQTGDQVLRLVAHCLKTNVKGRDTAARYGGEEFAVILPKTTLDDAKLLADQLRHAVEAKRVIKKTTGESLGTITVSLGASLFTENDTIEDLIQRADACLYAAKRGGRNQVKGEDEVDINSVLESDVATSANVASA